MSKLRAKPPEESESRLKMLLFGPPGSGKTTAAIQMPRPCIIDCERGSVHYKDLIDKAGGAVLQTRSVSEIIEEIHRLITEKHPYQTLVIDPVTTAYNELLEGCEKRVGTDFGRHYGAAGKSMKRLMNLILSLDMNVIMTSHAKNEYGEGLKVIGQTFDAWKSLPYMFDLVIRLNLVTRTNREAEVVKTRLSQFPSGDRFAWSYEAIAERYGVDIMERDAKPVELATAEHVDVFSDLLAKLTESEIERLGIKKALRGVDDVADLEDARIVNGILLIEAYLKNGKKKGM